ncbi:PH domain-containing protein [Nostocoides sp.]|uniref:PH domain-containing protein n=1 Tax=Nostocoides sp. TaxID=1917966 RepID=UPI002CD86D55|nr:PH domain-containing protein [Tetrasphaera sp.]
MAEEIYFDKKEQLQIVQNSLLPDETVFAVYDGKDVGTGFIGLTDRRVILQDNSFAGGRVAVTSVPYSKVTAVSYASNASVFGRFTEETTVAIHTSHGTYEVLLRGSDKAKHTHDVILHYVVHA